MESSSVSLYPTVDPNTAISNPLNMIIPTYETLYRALAHAFLQDRLTACQVKALPSMLGSKTDESLGGFCTMMIFLRCKLTPSSLQVKEIDTMLPFVHEVLRIYPPVKRIHRMDADVDIATIHRDCNVFGPTAGQFDPTRCELAFIPGSPLALI